MGKDKPRFNEVGRVGLVVRRWRCVCLSRGHGKKEASGRVKICVVFLSRATRGDKSYAGVGEGGCEWWVLFLFVVMTLKVCRQV